MGTLGNRNKDQITNLLEYIRLEKEMEKKRRKRKGGNEKEETKRRKGEERRGDRTEEEGWGGCVIVRFIHRDV